MSKRVNDLSYYLKEDNVITLLKIDKPHDVLPYDLPIVVCLKEIINSNLSITTNLTLYKDERFVGIPIILNFTLPKGEMMNIAKEMYDEYISFCDFADLDKELNGKCASDYSAHINVAGSL